MSRSAIIGIVIVIACIIAIWVAFGNNENREDANSNVQHSLDEQ